MTLTRDTLLELIETASPPAVTITFPTFRSAPDTQQNPVRYRNMLRDAENRLAGNGARRGDPMADAFAEAWAYAEEPHTFAKPRDGMALFLCSQMCRIEKLAFSPPESLHIGQTFAVRPFFHLMKDREKFLVLAAAYGHVQFYESDGATISSIGDEGLRETIDQILAKTMIDNSIGFHTVVAGQASKFHALGESPADTAEDLRKEFAARVARVADAACAKRNHPPLVVVADDRLLGEIQANSKTEMIATPETRVPPSELGEDDLLALANDALAPRREDAVKRRIEEFRAHYGDPESEKAATNPAKIALAAISGRIDALFVTPSADLRGELDRETGEIRFAGQRGDLIDDMARAAITAQGDIIEVPEGTLPKNAPVGALFRW